VSKRDRNVLISREKSGKIRDARNTPEKKAQLRCGTMTCVSARPLSGFVRITVLLMAAPGLCCAFGALGCESTEAAPPPPKPAHVHPTFPMPKSPEMIAQSVDLEGDAGARRAAAAASAVPDPAHWNASCLAKRGCPTKQKALPECEPGKPSTQWIMAQANADSLVGKVVDLNGMLGLTPTLAPSKDKCPPDTCCHRLGFGITLDGTPLALPLKGYSCTGDDSKLCCTVPTDAQRVIAHGRLTKAAGTGLAQWQLEDVTLCALAAPPAPEH